MKRLFCLMLCVMTAVLVGACHQDKTESAPTQVQTEALTEAAAPTAAAQTENTDALGLKAFINSFDKSTVVQEKEIYHQDDLTVTVKGIDYSAISGPGLQLAFESKYNKDIIIQSPYAAVNGFMIRPGLSAEVAAGKTAEGTLTLPYFNLAISNITSLKKIEFALRIVEAKSYNPIAKTDLIIVNTSSDDGKETVCNETGQTAYDKDGVKITLQGVNTDRAFSDGAELMVYMCNDTDKSIAVQTDEVIVNGYDMTSAMNLTILPGKRAVDVVTFYKLDMEENDIEVIDSVKISFTLKNADNWETIDSTDLINVELKQAETLAAATQAATAGKGS